tara:strand:- start:5 stop:883 length:879 start_codon:yes stop_codon:yes gene_type:complete
MGKVRVAKAGGHTYLLISSIVAAVVLTAVFLLRGAFISSTNVTLKHEELARLTVALFEAFEQTGAERPSGVGGGGGGGGGSGAAGDAGAQSGGAARTSSGAWATTIFNFGGSRSEAGEGVAIDIGRVFGDRANGMRYGWSSDHTSFAATRYVQTGTIDDSLIHIHPGLSQWDVDVPPGTYEVAIKVGDLQYSGEQRLRVQGKSLWSGDLTCCESKGSGCTCVGPSFLTKTVEVVVAAGATLRIDAGSTVDPQHRASPAKGSKAGRLIHARVRQTSKAAGAAGAVSGGVDVLV